MAAESSGFKEELEAVESARTASQIGRRGSSSPCMVARAWHSGALDLTSVALARDRRWMMSRAAVALEQRRR